MDGRASARRFIKLRRRVAASTKNALELIRLGRLAPDMTYAFDVVDRDATHRLRRYHVPDTDRPQLLLVPPLMVTSEVYDVAPEVSAVGSLIEHGVAPWLCDFGAPEHEEGGLGRTLDDHVRAVVKAIDRVRELTGRDVHLAGYSQGGMFAYQACAYRRSEGIRSLVTFGAPVDIHLSVPIVSASLVGAFVLNAEPVLKKVLAKIEGLPGALTSTGFKILSTKKEIEQRIDFLRKLHDRKALERREARRRFLGGEGFVAWPGPAFRDFVDDFIVHNRMLSGGFVIDGRTVTLADITCPVLCFMGTQDDMARPAAVRAITRAAPKAEVSFVEVNAGHFGIVVGSKAMHTTWPVVSAYARHVDGLGPKPAILEAKTQTSIADEPEGAGFEVDVDFDLFVDGVKEALKDAWKTVGAFVENASDTLEGIRYQEPRLRRLAEFTGDSIVSPSLSLRERAEEDPTATFFLWRGRAFSFGDADKRVTNVTKGLYRVGVRPHDRVAVVMGSRPSFLTMVTALSRLGAVSVLLPPESLSDKAREALDALDVAWVVADPELCDVCRDTLKRPVLVLGAGRRVRNVGEGLTDLETVDPDAIELPEGFVLDGSAARDLLTILLRPSAKGLRAAYVTYHRWALSAFGAAAACTLKPADTVYCAIPLHHPAAVLVSVGSALVSGSRLAIGSPFTRATFHAEAKRYGATVVFYAGEMLRPLVAGPASEEDRSLAVRLFAGSGMRVDLWHRLTDRFRAGVMEFYAATEERVVIANASGRKVGAVGRPLPGSVAIVVARVDRETGELVRNDAGRVVRAARDEPGILLSAVDDAHVHALSDRRLIEGVLTASDRWQLSSDVVRVDADGDVWFMGSVTEVVRTREGLVSLRAVEDALYGLREVDLACAFETSNDSDANVAAWVTTNQPIDAARLTRILSVLEPHGRPRYVSWVDAIPLTDGFRPRKRLVQAAGTHRELVRARFALSEDRSHYEEG